MKILKNISISICLVVFLVACDEKYADIENSSKYDHKGISFLYPGNWKVTEDEEVDGFRYLFIETPGAAIAKIEIYPIKSFDLMEFAEIDIKDLKENIPNIFKIHDKSKIIEFQNESKGIILNGLRYEFNLSILGLDIPHSTEYYMFHSENESAYFSNQVALEDHKKVKDGFTQVLHSFKIEQTLTRP